MNPLPAEPSEEAQERASLFALGLLAPEEAAAFEQEMSASPALVVLVAELRAGLEEVVRDETAVAPPPPAALRDDLLEAVADRPRSGVVVPWSPAPSAWTPSPTVLPVLVRPRFALLPWAAAASFALATGLLAWQLHETRVMADEALARASDAERRNAENLQKLTLAAARLGDADARLTAVVSRAAELEAEVARRRDDSPHPTPLPALPELATLRTAVLRPRSGADPAANATATVVWDATQSRGMLTVSGLPPAPAGRNYQLWVIDPAQPTAPISAGVFQVNASGVTRVLFQPVQATSRAEQFAISVEATGARQKPEGPVWLAGG